MRIKWDVALRKSLAIGAICFILAGQHGLAQNLSLAGRGGQRRRATWRFRAKRAPSQKGRS